MQTLRSLWNTPEGLTTVFYWLQWILAGLAILVILVGSRRDRISAAAAELEIGRLQARTEPRRLTNREETLERLPHLDGRTHHLLVIGSNDDVETSEYAQAIERLLQDSGWSAGGTFGNSFPKTPGVAMVLPPENHPSRALAERVYQVLRASGVITYDATEVPFGTRVNPENEIVILVGRRP
jgi:hypothetical protein